MYGSLISPQTINSSSVLNKNSGLKDAIRIMILVNDKLLKCGNITRSNNIC